MQRVSYVIALCGLLLATTGCKQAYAEKKVRGNLSRFEQTALNNLELEGVTRKQVKSFFERPAEIPSYKHLQHIQAKQGVYKKDAEEFSKNDKEKHCYLGFRIAKDNDFKSGIFMSFYKEASDVGDAKKTSKFEIADMIATRIGARHFKNGKPLSECLKVNDILANRVAKYEARIQEANQKLKTILSSK